MKDKEKIASLDAQLTHTMNYGHLYASLYWKARGELANVNRAMERKGKKVKELTNTIRKLKLQVKSLMNSEDSWERKYRKMTETARHIEAHKQKLEQRVKYLEDKYSDLSRMIQLKDSRE